MMNLFQGKREFPFHLSIGAILANDKGQICCHYYPEGLPYESGDKGELHLLMRETPHQGESIEEALHRGIKEEFGAVGEIVHFMGSIQSWFPGVTTGITIHKTTLYFLVNMTSVDLEDRDRSDIESTSTLLWLRPEALIEIFKKQGKRFKRTDLDESQIIQNYIEYVRN